MLEQALKKKKKKQYSVVEKLRNLQQEADEFKMTQSNQYGPTSFCVNGRVGNWNYSYT